MSSQQYVTITYYKEREFYFLSYAIQTEEGFIPKEIEQFHESDKAKFIDRIEMLQSEFPNHHVVSLSLNARQAIASEENRNKASATIFKDNYVIQDQIDVGDIPTTLYFSPFAILYEQYKETLDDSIKLIIGLFDRKLFMMFATANKIHQSWIIGTRGLSEKQVAERVYKSMQAYYKISYSFADHLEMLVTDESPKLLKVLREELSLHITLTQNSIHNLLHMMAGSQEKAQSSYIKSFKSIEYGAPMTHEEKLSEVKEVEMLQRASTPNPTQPKENLKDIQLKEKRTGGLMEEIRSFFLGSGKQPDSGIPYMAAVPLFMVMAMGGYFMVQNGTLSEQLVAKEKQIASHKANTVLASKSESVFSAMGKNGELTIAKISAKSADLKGMVWGIEPLKKSLLGVYPDGNFKVNALENFMTEFTFKSK